MKRRLCVIMGIILVLGISATIFAWIPLPVDQDPLVRMPGTQPNQVALESPTRCLNCHANYNTAVEPGFNWQGSMMAQSARDFLFYACMTVAAQDSIWALGGPTGRPNAVDICERCHFPKGWLEGRSDPPNASAMTGADFDGVQCDFCHRMYDPFFETTFKGSREGSDWVNYWDEAGTLSQGEADATYWQDSALAQAITLFNGGPFFVNNVPPPDYTESGSGQYFVSPNTDKRASFADAAAKHRMLYSRYHKSKYFCSTCHDVSNPILNNLNADPAHPLPTELNSAYSYFHVERTFSEFMLSAYAQQGGAPGIGPYAPAVFETSYANNYIAKCQDCHMRDGVGPGCNKTGAPIRTGVPATTESAEHPYSGLPIHDLTGGNAWVSYVLASATAGSPNYDAVNDQILNQGPATLTLDLRQGEGIDPPALLAGVDRAKQQLVLAASIQNVNYNPSNGTLSFRVQNQTGHKLISGFPEGRRMFVNVTAFSGGNLVYQANPYDNAAGTLKGLHYNYQPDPNGVLPLPQGLTTGQEAYVDELVYEMHPESALTGETESFHFALATGRHKDNRIPPKGFRIAEADARLSVPVYYDANGNNVGAAYFTTAEYAGGYDDVTLQIAAGADYVEVNLYYQTTSREYIEFLRDEINGNVNNLTLPASAYVVQTDPFFDQLKAWGDIIWDLWTHNMNVPGAAPFLMTQASWGMAPQPCGAPTPTLESAVPASNQVTLTWTDESADPMVVGYKIYKDQSGKVQLVHDTANDADPLTNTFTDKNLTNGVQYCYLVTSYYATCESGFTNILCATPNAGGQPDAGVTMMETGKWVTTGKGKNQTTFFDVTSAFRAGDAVVIRAYATDGASGLPLPNATVDLEITGPEVVLLTTGLSDANGIAEATWQTAAPNKKGVGGTPIGVYAATTINVTATSYSWDGEMTSATFTIQ